MNDEKAEELINTLNRIAEAIETNNVTLDQIYDRFMDVSYNGLYVRVDQIR